MSLNIAFRIISWRRGGHFHCAPLTRAFHVQHFMPYKLNAKVTRASVALIRRCFPDNKRTVSSLFIVVEAGTVRIEGVSNVYS